jgi:hypothetical protein
MDDQERALREAIAAIDAFVTRVSQDPYPEPGRSLQDLSLKIERARMARESSSPAEQPALTALFVRYRRSLERLRDALARFESQLTEERSRVLDEHRRVLRIHEWHALWSRSQ